MLPPALPMSFVTVIGAASGVLRSRPFTETNEVTAPSSDAFGALVFAETDAG